MGRVYVLIVTLVTISGCSKEWCYNRYPSPKKDSVSLTEQILIDTIYIPMPADTVFLKADVDCADQKIIYKDGKTEYKIIIKDKVLTLTKISEADSSRLIRSFMNTSEFRNLTKVKEVFVTEYKTPKIAWYSYLLNGILILWITRKIWVKLIKI
jgi:hypothetical protein